MKTSLLNSDTQLNQTSYYEASVQREPVGAPLAGAPRRRQSHFPAIRERRGHQA